MKEESSVSVDQNELGLLINRLREEQGLTTTALAQRVGISQAQISRLENGRQGFRSSTLAKIADALGYDAKVVFVQQTGDNL